MKLTDAIRRKVAEDYGRQGGLKARNQVQAAKASHSRAAEAKRRATRAAKAAALNGIRNSTDNGKS